MLSIEVSEGIARLTLSHPPVNAISVRWLVEFDRALDQLAARGDWKVLHIRSDQKAFCAGADLKEMRERFEAPDGADRTYAYVGNIQRLYARIEKLPQVTLAEIGGAALGGGCELALSCDLRIAANEAKVGLPEVKLGLIPGAGGTQRMTRIVGRNVANRLILGAEAVDGATASALGLVHWAVPRAELANEAAAIVKRVAALPAAALAASKACIAAAGEPGGGGFMQEIEVTRALQSNPETRERVAAFLAGARP